MSGGAGAPVLGAVAGTGAAVPGADDPGTTVPPRWQTATTLGPIGFVALDRADSDLLHAWLTHPRSAFWQMGRMSAEQVRAYVDELVADDAQDGWWAWLDGAPIAYVETYDPHRLVLDAVVEIEPGDLGMHLLVGPPDGAPRSGLTSAVMGAVVGFCLADDGLAAARVVVEPDVRNTAVHEKNAAAGFRVVREVDLPDKRALLSVCSRADYARSPLGPGHDAAPHLRPDAMAAAHRHLVAKTVAELSHERLLVPEPVGSRAPRGGRGQFRLRTHAADGAVDYTFTAHVLDLEHWVLDEASIVRTVAGSPAPLDALALVNELQPVLQIPAELLPTYLEEVSSTLAAAAAKHVNPGPGSQDLLGASFQQTEAAMTEGHPAFVANNGRIGFSLADYEAFAPERGSTLRLQWLAARTQHTHLALGAGRTPQQHWDVALRPDERRAFAARLSARGLDPADYTYLPVHPWQWEHRVAITFAPDVARHDLVPVGVSAHEYQPQQSIRTLADRTDDTQDYVKVALAIQNMGFLRGLSPAYMRHTPAINDWVADLVHGDPTLRRARFEVLREHATVGYTGDAYHGTATTSPYRKMLAALWRESPVPRLLDGERLVTMAALLHRDREGEAYATALIRASGRTPRDWLRAYLDVYLRPLAHCLLAHDLAFMPHGENLILGLADHTPVRAFMKDIGEEVAVLSDRPLPADVERVRAEVDETEKALAIFTDVYDGVLRHLAGILHVDGVLDQDDFWAEVGACLRRHRDDHPDLSTGVDLHARTFAHSCLNRLQLRNTLQMVDLTDQSSSLIYAGQIDNPAVRA
ncbi:GNAT family N-acetyltransferase [Paraoerskovia marina]|uniref:GNAT family N-acetyltransferase n=1 Tax=Paraoerskovia marina TaxID=545619 RepID=UPI0009DFD1D4|nr:GNAT family N-acetyltransferase [Paraoerskovia marina]